MPEKFKTGDIVQLKSGGPKMTVHSYATRYSPSEPNTVHCQWFAGAKMSNGVFPEDALVSVTE